MDWESIKITEACSEKLERKIDNERSVVFKILAPVDEFGLIQLESLVHFKEGGIEVTEIGHHLWELGYQDDQYYKLIVSLEDDSNYLLHNFEIL
ncbi:hypothetical protein ABC255_02165 [Neobacillus sp. 3P2-tot-E-2]|uniref:hypothetical protein n=1 Tax=Neobacillus sp. 3P2-tot-E-2 TaxID=3132212 RepID=UPI0039A35C2D